MKNAFLYFILFPFLGFVNAIKNYRSSWSKYTIIAFVAFFGLTMIKTGFTDSTRYVQNLEIMYDSNKDFETIQNSLYSQEEGQVDIYVTLTTFVISMFTNNGNLLFLLYGLIFGFFYANNIWMVLNQSKGKLSWEKVLVLITFSMVVGFWSLNGVRMWTAAHIFFFGGFLYLFEGKKKGLLIAASSILVHFSFVLPVGLLLAYSAVSLNYRVLYIFYVASFFIVELNIDFIKNFLENNMPEFILPKVKTYLNEDYIETASEVLQKANWYAANAHKPLSYFNLIFVSVILFRFKNFDNAPIKKLLGFSVFFLTVANIASLLPSGVRFLSVAFLFFTAASFIIVANTKDKFITRWVKFLSPLLILFCVIAVRNSMDFINITILTNPVVALLTDINIPIIDLIK